MEERSDDDLFLQQLITRGYESADLDYKGPGGWSTWGNTERAEFVRDLAGFANGNKPGWLIIGVAESERTGFTLIGLTDNQATGFDPTDIAMFANNYIQPPVAFRVYKPVFDDCRYVVVRVEPFGTIPHICIKSFGEKLHEAAIYVRTQACQTTKVFRPEQLRELVDRATTNGADALVARIDEIYRRARNQPTQQPAPSTLFEEQLHSINREPQ